MAKKGTTKNSLEEHFASDEDGAENGAWVTIRPGIRMRLRSIHSKLVRREEAKMQRKNRPQIIQNNGVLDPETIDDNEILLVQRVGCVEWEGITDDEGAVITCTPDNRTKVFTKYPQLRREVLFHMRSDETFRPPEQVKAELDALAKNS